MQPDPSPSPSVSLSPSVRDLTDRLEQLAREHPEASKPVLVWLLAAEYCPARLKRRWRP